MLWFLVTIMNAVLFKFSIKQFRIVSDHNQNTFSCLKTRR